MGGCRCVGRWVGVGGCVGVGVGGWAWMCTCMWMDVGGCVDAYVNVGMDIYVGGWACKGWLVFTITYV